MNGMNELEYIENYFSDKLSYDDKEAFERRCESDTAFAQEVSFYILTRQQLQTELLQKKRSEFIEQYHELSGTSSESLSDSRTWFSYVAAAAACVLILIAYLTFFQNEKPSALAETYIDENLTTLSTTMTSGTDSLALGIGAFNQKDYGTAETIFHSLGKNESLAPETTKYLGITYLNTGEYEKAIEQFNELIRYTELYANPGKFYLAITLMKRSREGDKEEAKKLLQEVVTKELPGYKEASEWMKHL